MATATVFGISLGYIFAQYFGKEVKNSGKEEEKSNGPRYGGLRFFKADEDAEQVKRIVKFLVSHAKNVNPFRQLFKKTPSTPDFQKV
eukprot:1355195-Amorphochlora_amoeboformis.AAC.1